jgi:hypothetical protein
MTFVPASYVGTFFLPGGVAGPGPYLPHFLSCFFTRGAKRRVPLPVCIPVATAFFSTHGKTEACWLYI